MEEGAVVRVAFQQADGMIKLRPSVVLKHLAPYGDLIICAVSSKLKNEVKDLDVLIGVDHPDRPRMGLPFPSLIRTGYLTTFPRSAVQDTLGAVSNETLVKLKENLITYFKRGL